MTLDHLRSRLVTYLARRPEQSMGSLGPLTPLKGGWASSLYILALQPAESGDAPATTSVLKMYAPNARGREHATREWCALTHLRASDYPVPRAVLFEPDSRHLGHPFIVMEHIPGTSLWHAFEAADPVAQAELARLFVAQLVALHALDPALLETTAIRRDPYSFIDQELGKLRRDSANSPHVMLTEIVKWLEERKQHYPCERPAILHRDYHPWNVMVDISGHLWIIDWDWQIGDVRFDLAWTCALMQRSDFHKFGRAVRDEYTRQSDRSIDDLGYFGVLTTVRWLLNVLPSVESDSLLDAATRAEFRAFLVEPVRRAKTFLQDHTGIDVYISI